MGGKQIQVGNNTETNVATLFRNNHYWVHLMAKKTNGQPCDIVAVRNNVARLVDAKHIRVQDNRFGFDRIEPNQLMCFDYNTNYCNNTHLGFAIESERDKTIYWFSYQDYLKRSQNGLKSVNMSELEKLQDIIK